MAKKDLIYLSKIERTFDEDINNCFSDNEEIMLERKARVLTKSIEAELQMINLDNKAKKILDAREKLQRKLAEEGRGTKGLWLSDNGAIRVEDMTDKHLACIPRFLIKNNRIDSIDEIPEFILEEIKKRGWTINKNGYVNR